MAPIPTSEGAGWVDGALGRSSPSAPAPAAYPAPKRLPSHPCALDSLSPPARVFDPCLAAIPSRASLPLEVWFLSSIGSRQAPPRKICANLRDLRASPPHQCASVCICGSSPSPRSQPAGPPHPPLRSLRSLRLTPPIPIRANSCPLDSLSPPARVFDPCLAAIPSRASLPLEVWFF